MLIFLPSVRVIEVLAASMYMLASTHTHTHKHTHTHTHGARLLATGTQQAGAAGATAYNTQAPGYGQPSADSTYSAQGSYGAARPYAQQQPAAGATAYGAGVQPASQQAQAQGARPSYMQPHPATQQAGQAQAGGYSARPAAAGGYSAAGAAKPQVVR